MRKMHKKKDEINNSSYIGEDRQSQGQFENEIETLRQNNLELSRALADARIQIGDYRQREIELQNELLDLREKSYNQIRTMMQKIEGNAKDILTNFVTVSDNLSTILHVCNLFNAQIGIMNKSNQGEQQVRTTHAIVKPQIVNGHVLQNPTITLTRAEVPQRSSSRFSRNVSQVETEINSFSVLDRQSVVPTVELNVHAENSSANDIELNHNTASPSSGALQQRLNTLVEEDESMLESGETSTASTPLRSKSVISGIFHDVKIYLNQLPMEVVNSNLNQSNNSIDNLTENSSFSQTLNNLKEEAASRRMTVSLSAAILNNESRSSRINDSSISHSQNVDDESNPLEFVNIKRRNYENVPESPVKSFSSLTPTGSSTPFHTSRNDINLRSSEVGVTKRRQGSTRNKKNSEKSSENSNTLEPDIKAVNKKQRKRILEPENDSDEDKSIRISKRQLNKSSKSVDDEKQSTSSDSDSRPRRAARPQNLKEPRLNKKMRR